MYLYLISIFILATGFPQHPKHEIIQQEFKPLHNTADGGQAYEYSFETNNGLYRSEKGYFSNTTKDNFVVGQYEYPDPDGNVVVVSYIGDSNGFRISPEISSRIPSAALASLAGR